MAEKKVNRIGDEVVVLLDGYEALEELAIMADGAGTPVVDLLEGLNRQLRCVVGRMDDVGMVT